ncbi:MAG: IS1595 family transposase [Candidatus Acidiferrales bacterium]
MPTVSPIFERVNLPDLMARFDCESKCREYLETLRWPDGPVCPKCGKKEIARVGGRESILRCVECQAQFTVMAGTVFNDSHLPLSKWFLATFLLCESKKGVSALQLQRILGIGGYKTAWYLCHRIRSAMIESQKELLKGIVEIDETYIGGKPRINRPRKEKQVVVGIRVRGGDLRLIRAKEATSKAIRKIVNENVSEDVEVIITDESAIYPWAFNKKQNAIHKTICHKSVYVSGDVHTNTVENAFSLFKRGIVGTWHKMSTKHLQAYLDEMVFRFNRRKSTTLFQDTLRHMVTAPVLTFQRLTKERAA